MTKSALPLKNKTFDRNQIIMLFPLLIILGKLVRFTIMKDVLVDASIGWEFLPRILNDDWYFALSSLEESTTGSAKYNAIAIYKILNLFLNTKSFYVFEAAITVIFNLILVWLFRKIERKIDFYSGIFFMLFVIVLNIFDFTLAKEPIQMLYFVLMFLCLMNKRMNVKKKLIGVTAILFLCVLTFRTYYIFIIYFMYVTLAILWFMKATFIKNKKVKMVLLLAFIAVSFVVLMIAIKKIALSEYAYMLRLRTKANRTGAASQINVLFGASSGSTFVYVIDLMILVIRMLFPIELCRLGSKYLLYVLFQLFISINFIRSLIRYSKEKMSVELIALCVYIGFLVGSSTFEPDFGSWVRHEAVLFPIIILMCGYVKTQNVKGSIKNLIRERR